MSEGTKLENSVLPKPGEKNISSQPGTDSGHGRLDLFRRLRDRLTGVSENLSLAENEFVGSQLGNLLIGESKSGKLLSLHDLPSTIPIDNLWERWFDHMRSRIKPNGKEVGTRILLKDGRVGLGKIQGGSGISTKTGAEEDWLGKNSEGKKPLIDIHTHPDDTAFSGEDLTKFLWLKSLGAVVVGPQETFLALRANETSRTPISTSHERQMSALKQVALGALQGTVDRENPQFIKSTQDFCRKMKVALYRADGPNFNRLV